MDARRLYLGAGYSSLFTYCTQALHLSEHAAYGRIEAARAARRFPLVMDLLANGSLTVTTVGLLAPHLTADNHRNVLESACHKRKREGATDDAGSADSSRFITSSRLRWRVRRRSRISSCAAAPVV
jgi:hypothetical protein